DEPRRRDDFAVHAGHAHRCAFVAAPLVAVLAADPQIDRAHRHRPAVGAETPLSHELGLRVALPHERSRGGEAAFDDDLGVGRRRNGESLCHWSPHPAYARSSAATSIFFIFSIASITRLAFVRSGSER